jgi:phosphate transport system permease protein
VHNSEYEKDNAAVTRISLAPDTARRRRVVDKVMTGLVFLAVALAITPLVLILGEVVLQGAPVISLSFLTNLPTPVGVPGGGIANALFGSFIMVGIATLIAVPIGVGAGIFFSEWPESRLSTVSSFTNDVLAEFPSIVIGIFVYIIIVLSTKTFSAFAGAFALSIIMVPIIARTTEESLKVVPMTLREASMALGVSRWRTVIKVVISTGKSGLVTGILLAVARAAGETAPLILTALGSVYFPTGLFQPTAALPLLIYTYGISPFRDWQAQAWGAALILIVVMLVLNLSIKLLIGRRSAERAET